MGSESVKLNRFVIFFIFDFLMFYFQVFCGHCSQHCVPLPHYGIWKAVRVCNVCFLYYVTFSTDTTPNTSWPIIPSITSLQRNISSTSTTNIHHGLPPHPPPPSHLCLGFRDGWSANRNFSLGWVFVVCSLRCGDLDYELTVTRELLITG